MFLVGKKEKLDLGIILGSSGADYLQIFKDQKSFVKNMFARLNIGSSSVLPGVIVNGENPRISISIGDVLTKSDAIRELLKITNPGSQELLYNALYKAKNDLFKNQKSSRTGVPKSLLIFLNKEPKKTSELSNAIKELKEAGVKIVVVMQGKDTNKAKVKNATANAKEWFFPDDSDAAVDAIKDIIAALLPGR